MDAQQASQSSGSMPKFSPAESIRTYGCKWAWCRSTFSDNAELVHHVIHDHARRTIPVRRRDIPLLRRAEEGTGESLQFSYTFTSQSSTSDRVRKPSDRVSQEASQDVPSHGYGASSSLPSPPTSSLTGFSPPPASLHLPQDTSLSHKTLSRTSAGIFEDPPHTPPYQLPDQMENTFASLSSPADSAASFAIADIPNSPSFSALVKNSVKARLTFSSHVSDNLVASGSGVSQNHPLSQSTSSSTGSHISVEQQLTQTPESDSEEENQDEERVSNRADVTLGPSPRETNASSSQLHSNRLQNAELPPPELQDHHFTQESEFQPANYDLLSQAPSQFQVDSFPYHYHGAKSKVSMSSQIQSQPTPSLQLSPPAPLHSPGYATSTPQRQNWYQTPHLINHNVSKPTEKRRRDEDNHPERLQRPPSRSGEHTSRASSPSKSKRFKSGTLHVPAAIHAPAPESMFEGPMQGEGDSMGVAPQDIYSQSQSSSDTESMEDLSYPPLQTQAPYQSQSWSQF